MREVLGPLFRFLLRPSSIGALYVTLLSLRAAGDSSADVELGRDAQELTSFVNDRFGAEVTRAAVAIVAAAIVLGAILGALAGLAVILRDRMARAPKRSAASRAWAVLGVTASGHAWLLFHSASMLLELAYLRFQLQRRSIELWHRQRRLVQVAR